MSKNNPVVEFYNGLADNYDAEQEEFAFVRVPEKELILKTFQEILTKDMSVLEIGAGTGRFTLEMAPQVKDIQAVDIAGNMLAQLKEKLITHKISNVEIINDDFLNISFNKQFNLIVSFSAIEYLKNEKQVFHKLNQSCKTGGHLLITTAHNTFLRMFGRLGNYFRQKVYMNAFRKKKMIKLLEENGFQLVRMDDLVLKSWISKGILLFVYAKKVSESKLP
ncbi:MAG: methyltransferase domain-containing protein [Spirochaetota bacterium]|nr:methyltransferase domain-containing protein [Spirochaetota bacterium]